MPHMHRLPSRYAVNRFKLAAWLLAVKWLLAAVSVLVIGYAMFVFDTMLAIIGIGAFMFCGVMAIMQWLVAARARCPLCLTQPVTVRGCSTNRNAKRLFGSHRLQVAVSIILRNQFRCPYCGELTTLEVRDGFQRRSSPLNQTHRNKQRR
jgi:hypothetical protein